MSAIDELKNTSEIVIGTNDEVNEDVGIVIDSVDDNAINRVDLSSLNNSRKVSSNHRFIKPDLSKSNPTKTNTARKTVNIDAISTPEKNNEEEHISPVLDIVDPENPNSLLSKYVKEKDQEAREWITNREEERAVLEEEAESGIELDATNNNVIDFAISNTNIRMTRDDDIDISGIFEDNYKEEIGENDMSVNTNNDEELNIDANIDTEDLEEAVETTETDYEDEVEDNDVEVENISIGEVEEESEDTFDIDVEEQQTTGYVTEIEEDDDNTTTEVGSTDDKEVLRHLQKLATEKLKPISKQLDISSFTILKKPVTNVNPIFQESSARVIKWVLPSQESIVLMKEFSGSELEKLREYSENTRSVDSLNRRFHMIYDHIVSPKPATFEAWLKSTPFEDIEHYFFAIYIASFKGANYLPADCINSKCNETFITDDINIMDMVKFDNKEAKDKFAKLYSSESVPAGKGVYCTEVVPMNDKIAIAFRQPSIYNAFEIASLDEKTRAKYSAIVEYIPYIDTIYAIDSQAKTLTPITYKMFPDNSQRTIRSKIQKYDSLFSVMSVDEFGAVKAYATAITERNSGIKYVYPAVECPKCHTMTNEQVVSAEELVFTRYQLGSLVTTSLN